jgi:hypothetical protein
MAIKVKCIRCKKSLKKKGGIMLSPPSDKKTLSDEVVKSHLCGKCYRKVIDWIERNG